ncbi:MAG: excalibur calcium-binding domain-containing protein [Gordonia amarae]
MTKMHRIPVIAGSALAAGAIMAGAFAPIASAATGDSAVAGQQAAKKTTKYYNTCAALNERYPHGVARAGATDHVTAGKRPVTGYIVNTNIYNHNKKLDYDNDGIACEQ